MMTGTKRIKDLTDYTSVLPYASELFGVYQPLIGWRSKRRQIRIRSAGVIQQDSQLAALRRRFWGDASVNFNADSFPQSARIGVGRAQALVVRPSLGSVLLDVLAARLQEYREIPREQDWAELINEPNLVDLLNRDVFESYRRGYLSQFRQQAAHDRGAGLDPLQTQMTASLRDESAVAGMLLELVNREMFEQLHSVFYAPRADLQTIEQALSTLVARPEDPYLAFDPKRDVNNVTMSPIGIVHLFRQYFFELDTFLGSPVGHVWLSPGSTIELIEVSTRKTVVEKTIETALETTSKSERRTTDQDELSDAVKQQNRDDMKLGFSATVNQSWCTGNATATGSINLDKTQENAREESHKRLRQQSEKLSTEIRQSFRSTFRTLTETVDTSSKRYVLNNATDDLINYEMRRKMRQVGVQIQDVGTYLCWETFIDDPGRDLAMPHLIHIAQPADLVLVPNPKLLQPSPETVFITFSGEATWYFPNNDRQYREDHPETRGQFFPLATFDIPGIPQDYELVYDNNNPFIPVEKQVIAAQDDASWSQGANWAFLGMITPDAKRVMVGVITKPKPGGQGGLAWNQRIVFKVSGALTCRLSAAKKSEIDNANAALLSAKLAADAENQRRMQEAYVAAVRNRVTLASKIQQRNFDDLREEERTIVYRHLIASLMIQAQYENLPDNPSGYQSRHVLSELINSIFDIEKMLYFVAPEWWKPRRQARLLLGGTAVQDSVNGSVVRWAEDQEHGKYFITDESKPAPLGSSLGWLLQLDGDNLRNAFLNAPWVKAVIPIRPGKERAAIQWLKNVNVEGADGLDADYIASAQELANIRSTLLAHDPSDPVSGRANVTLDDAVRCLCMTVAEKHAAANVVGRYPEEEINDDNRVSATPVERVFEHGFYPLQGGFKAKAEGSFEICSQWVEVLPTDQVVPVQVKYDPKTGRQL